MDLKSNSLISFHSDLFDSCNELTSLSNYLQFLFAFLFPLDMSNNKLTNIPRRLFSSLTKLESIYHCFPAFSLFHIAIVLSRQTKSYPLNQTSLRLSQMFAVFLFIHILFFFCHCHFLTKYRLQLVEISLR